MTGVVLNTFGPETVLATFLLFCRIGSCLVVIPGFSSQRVAMRIRLLVAIAATLAMAPILLPVVRAALPDMGLATVVRFIAAELFTGLLIGLMGRAFIAALQTIGSLMAMSVGMGNIPGVAVEGGTMLPPLASLVTLTATAMIFITDQHLEIFRGLAASYSTLPPTGTIAAKQGLEQLVGQLAEAFLLALRIGSPFVIYSIIVNFALGITNKLTPQIPVYFIAMPFVIAGGMYFLLIVITDLMKIFLDGYFTWLRYG